GLCTAAPALGQIDGLRRVVIRGYCIAFSRRYSVIVGRNPRSGIGEQPFKTQSCNLRGRHELQTGVRTDDRKIEFDRKPSFDRRKQSLFRTIGWVSKLSPI